MSRVDSLTIHATRMIHLSSYMKTTAIFFGLVGLLFGLLGLVGSVLGWKVFIALGPLYFEGILAGILGVPLMPVVFAIIGSLLALLTYKPVSWVYRHT